MTNPATQLEAEIARLRDLDLDELRASWRLVTGRRAPLHLTRHLLLRMIAYRIQADALGHLEPAIVRFLDRVLTDAKLDASGSLPLPDGERIKPGAVLVREWNGASHHVMALKDGFAWDGKTYPSLSAVAKAMTGTSWNGPRFFGLRTKSKTV